MRNFKKMNDTIAAIASGMTASGIGIVRISGPGAFHVLEKIFRPKDGRDVTKYRANTIHYGWVSGQDGSVIDECLVMIMRGPHTYTTEDTVEIDCHGGPFVMRKILEAVLASGARQAEPGEFTKRAFLGGRIDLTEAEAVMDVIQARSEDALKSSLSQLGGMLSSRIRALREEIMEELAFIEAALDDPEHYDLDGYPEVLAGKVDGLTDRLKKLEKSFEEGRLIREGILTVIIGKPNAGKSSLLNALTGGERAIVTDIEGTTRDVLEEQIVLEGLTLRIADTAGIREAKDRVEEIGIQRTREYVDMADLVLAVFDTSLPLDENDLDILRMTENHQSIILLNKSDLEPVITAETIREALEGSKDRKDRGRFSVFDEEDSKDRGRFSVFDEKSSENHMEEKQRQRTVPCLSRSSSPLPQILTISAKTEEGLHELGETIRSMFFGGRLTFNEENVLTNVRHRDACRRALASLALVKDSIEAQLPEDFYSIDLMDAYRTLGEIIGEEVGDDLVDMIFSRFCMGK